LAKDTRIKYLEEMVVKASLDLENAKAIEEIIRNKNANITSLKNKLKLLATEDP